MSIFLDIPGAALTNAALLICRLRAAFEILLTEIEL